MRQKLTEKQIRKYKRSEAEIDTKMVVQAI